jgi:hypothetical protein
MAGYLYASNTPDKLNRIQSRSERAQRQLVPKNVVQQR